MKPKFVPVLRTALLFVCALSLLSFGVAAVAQDAKKDEKPAQISDGEKQAIDKINKAATPAEKVKLSGDYVKKYGKSPMRNRIAGFVGNAVASVNDYPQRLSLSENYLKVFNLPEEANYVKPGVIEAYLNLNKFDEALKESDAFLQKNPDDVVVHVQLAWAAADQLQKQSATPKLLQAGTSSATKAVELMEQDKKPEWMTPENWNNYRNSWLARLYLANGMILLANKDKVKAKESFEKSVGIDSYDPATLLQLVNLTNEEYQDLAKKYQTEKKAEQLDAALAKMDEMIDWLARAVAATEGNAQTQQLNQQLRENLKAYFEFRNNGKTDGMNALVEKYKKK